MVKVYGVRAAAFETTNDVEVDETSVRVAGMLTKLKKGEY
jgi:hypothetical protein